MSTDFQIKSVDAIEVFDSRGMPTIEGIVTLESGIVGRAIVPSGASTGSMEACELRDGGDRIHGNGVKNAVTNMEKIATEIIGIDVREQGVIDGAMINLDGTKNKSKLGANTTLAASIACARAASSALGTQLYQYLGGFFENVLPVPMFNIINGGVHADNALDMQEFMIMPIGCDTFDEGVAMASTIFHTLKNMMLESRLNTNVGDEGGFAPHIDSATDALDLMMRAIEKSKYIPGEHIVFAIDVAATELYANGKYHFSGQGVIMDTDDLIQYYEDLINKYPIFSIEDPFAENDEDGFFKMTRAVGNRVQIVGDDLFVTSADLISNGAMNNIANAALIKPNQIGTLSETMEAIQMAHDVGYRAIISHRSGETEDVTISHIAVGTRAMQIKTGSICRTDRVAKYNELLRIQHNLGPAAQYAGKCIHGLFQKFRSNTL